MGTFLNSGHAYDRHFHHGQQPAALGRRQETSQTNRFPGLCFGTEWDINVSPDEQRLFPGTLRGSQVCVFC
jgi:hypothetical protein